MCLPPTFVSSLKIILPTHSILNLYKVNYYIDYGRYAFYLLEELIEKNTSFKNRKLRKGKNYLNQTMGSVD